MRNTKLKYIFRTLIVISVLVALLVSMNGCKKKKPDATEPSSTGETVAETTGSAENTTPDNHATQNTNPSQSVDATDNTNPTDETEDTCVHTLGNWIVEGEGSNCTKEGSRYKACSQCGKKVVTEVIPKTAHKESEWFDDKYEKVSCNAQGKKYKKCTQCDELLYTIVVDKANHNVLCQDGYPAKPTNPGRTAYYWCINQGCEFKQQPYEIPAEGTVPYQTTDSGSTCTIKKLASWTGSELILSSTINGKTVTAIGNEAFADLASVKTIYIPKSVTKIGDKAFSGCSGLTTIVYEGSMEDWYKVTKGTQWNQNTGNYVIHCNNRILSK